MKKPSPFLYQIIATAFCVIVIISNIVSTKMVKLPFFKDFSIPAGLMAYPVAFLLSDLVTEIFGPKKARQMVYLTFAMSILSFLILQLTLSLPAADLEQAASFKRVFGLNGRIVFGSLLAYVVGQTIDIQLYASIRKWTGPRFLWLRNNGSTFTAQIFDTAIVNLIHLYFGLGMALHQVAGIILFSYVYKCSFSLVATPLYYFAVAAIKKSIRLPIFSRDKKVVEL